jgi:3-phenylpropionate/trans-cinnamate dioxygenase ferredoxin subunit
MCDVRISAADEAVARWVRACPADVLGDRPMVAVTVEGQQLLIIRDGERLFAAERACPHEGADLAQGRCDRGRLHCPRHLAWFDLASGAVSPGWSFRALKTYAVRLDGDDILIDASSIRT